MITTTQLNALKKADIAHIDEALPLDDGEVKLKLAQALQSSLDVDDIIAHFDSTIKTIIPFSSLCYTNDKQRIAIKLGQDKVHSAKYNLKTKKYNLGELIFTRAKRFTEIELASLETFIGLLFYPLRNSLLYKEAIDNSLKEPITQIGNRAALELALTREINLVKREKKPLSILIADIDHFKEINDTFGHQRGDEFLKHVATIFQDTIREVDQVFRFGGDEFVVVLHDTGLPEASMIAERIRTNILATPYCADDICIDVTTTIGAASYAKDDTRETFFERADEALYLGKRAGRNCVVTEQECDTESTSSAQPI